MFIYGVAKVGGDRLSNSDKAIASQMRKYQRFRACSMTGSMRCSMEVGVGVWAIALSCPLMRSCQWFEVVVSWLQFEEGLWLAAW